MQIYLMMQKEMDLSADTISQTVDSPTATISQKRRRSLVMFELELHGSTFLSKQKLSSLQCSRPLQCPDHCRHSVWSWGKFILRPK